ncbi:MAG: GNAT family N-acetyltransferase, partial [Rhodococcus sp.]|nr:GNAT family N-acetyltransferase [Rhodococcus sp. (in: high G+C Gram-positive bacteria)]
MTVSEVFEPVSTERLVLRGYCADDVDDLLRYYSRHEVCRFLFDDPWTIDHARKVVQRKVLCRSLGAGDLGLVG